MEAGVGEPLLEDNNSNDKLDEDMEEMEAEGRKLGTEVVWITNCKGIAKRWEETDGGKGWLQRVTEGMDDQMRADGRMGLPCSYGCKQDL